MKYNPEYTQKILQLFSSLSDETRLRITLCLLERPRTVKEIHHSIGEEKMTLSAISHQLKQMHDINIIEFEKRGREKTFHLSDKFCWCILRDALGHFQHTKCPECSKVKK